MGGPGLPPLTAKPERPRAFVVRLPGVFVSYCGHKMTGSFQTVVMALSEEHAWDVAMNHDVWEQLPFEVKNPQIFPKDPVAAP